MNRAVLLTVTMSLGTLMVAQTTPAMAQDVFDDKCGIAPIAPEVPAAPPATEVDMKNLKSDVTAFIKASDTFQDCILKTLEQGPEFEKGTDQDQAKSIHSRFVRQGEKIILSNQEDKERVGKEFNRLIDLRVGAKPAPAKLESKSEPIAIEAAGPMLDAPKLTRSTAKAIPQVKPELP